VRLAEAILLEDLRTKGEQGGPDSRHDLWARAGDFVRVEDPDVDLLVHIEDAGARINLNGLLAKGVVDEKARLYLKKLLAGVIANMPGRPEELLYDPLELAANLADWIDSDEVSPNGAPEDELYQRRDPPYRPPNRPLLSVDELRLVAGFDGRLVDALKPLVGVYPLAGGGGVNLNTAPEWVLIQLQRGSEVSGSRGLEEKDVRRIADAREDGTICAGDAQAPGCTSLADLLKGDTIERAATERSKVFVVTVVARVVDIERRIETVIDRTAKGGPKRLSWRVQ